jgi:RND family efflux transporter MFP subunit
LFLGLATDEGYPYKGFLDFAAITLNPGTGTLQLRGVFKNSDRKLLPGLFAKIKAPVGKEDDAVLVPQQAVGYDQQGEYVMVVGPDDTVERRGVEQGALADDMRVITKGLKGDERVIVTGLMRAIPGRKVKPVTAQEAAEAASKADRADAAKGSSAPSQKQ